MDKELYQYISIINKRAIGVWWIGAGAGELGTGLPRKCCHVIWWNPYNHLQSSANKEAEVLFEEGRTTAGSSLPIPVLALLASARSSPRRSHTAVELQPRLLGKDMQRDWGRRVAHPMRSTLHSHNAIIEKRHSAPDDRKAGSDA